MQRKTQFETNPIFDAFIFTKDLKHFTTAMLLLKISFVKSLKSSDGGISSSAKYISQSHFTFFVS